MNSSKKGRRNKKEERRKLRRAVDRFGRTFGGKILIGNDRKPWKIISPKALPGADLTVQQGVAGLSMATHTGLTGGSSHLFSVNTGGFGAVFAFSLGDLPQLSQYSAVFDQFKIEEVQLKFIPLVTQLVTTNTATNFVDPSQFVLDFDDDNTLANENSALDYNNCQTAQSYEEVLIILRPGVAPAYYQGGAFSGYGVQGSAEHWLDIASSTIKHFGVKVWVGALAAASSMVAGWTVYGKYTVSFRNTR